jgi:hypothetical protein
VPIILAERAVKGERSWSATWMQSIKEGGKPYELSSRLGGSKLAYLNKITVVAFSIIIVIVAGKINHPSHLL